MSYRDPLIDRLQAIQDRLQAIDDEVDVHWQEQAPFFRMRKRTKYATQATVERYERWFKKDFCWTEAKKK